MYAFVVFVGNYVHGQLEIMSTFLQNHRSWFTDVTETAGNSGSQLSTNFILQMLKSHLINFMLLSA